MRLTNWIASATEADIGGRDGAAPGDGSSPAVDGPSVVGAGDKESAAGLDEMIATAIALCPVDAVKRDRGLPFLNAIVP